VFAGGLSPLSETLLVDPLFKSDFEFVAAISKDVTNKILLRNNYKPI
jgi:hypothetical protein